MATKNEVIKIKGRHLLPAIAKLRAKHKKINSRAFRKDWNKQRVKFLSDPKSMPSLPLHG